MDVVVAMCVAVAAAVVAFALWLHRPARRDPRAAELADDLVQRLTVASYALTLHQPARAHGAVDEALTISRSLLTRLAPANPRPGELRRSAPAIPAQSLPADPVPTRLPD